MHCVVAVIGYLGTEHFFLILNSYFWLFILAHLRDAKPETKLLLVRLSWQSSIVFGELKVDFR